MLFAPRDVATPTAAEALYICKGVVRVASPPSFVITFIPPQELMASIIGRTMGGEEGREGGEGPRERG